MSDPWSEIEREAGLMLREQRYEVAILSRACRAAVHNEYLTNRANLLMKSEAERVEFAVWAALGFLLGHGYLEARLPAPGESVPTIIPEHLRPTVPD